MDIETFADAARADAAAALARAIAENHFLAALAALADPARAAAAAEAADAALTDAAISLAALADASLADADERAFRIAAYAAARADAEVIEVTTVNEIGLAELAEFLRDNHQSGDKFGPSELSAWATSAEQNADDGNGPMIEIGVAYSVTGAPICYRISEAGISRSRHRV